ncbi:MAG: hypothetical protein ACOC8F_01600 [Planctomycetota bacterium]
MPASRQPAVEVTASDRDVIRALAGEMAEIAALPVHAEKAEMWRKCNDLEPVRPMVWITEVPWHEMGSDDELTLHCQSDWARRIEQGMRRDLYAWRHMRVDQVFSDYFPSPLAIRDTGFGIGTNEDIIRSDQAGGIASHHYKAQIVEPADVEKIRPPEVTHDEAASEREYAARRELLDGILPVRKVGVKGTWCAPWDQLVTWWEPERALMDLVMRPDMVEEAISRLVDAWVARLDQWEQLNLLTPNLDNHRIGSGAYGYTSELPRPDADPDRPRAADMWGAATAQIFSAVSPEMHWKFALKHEKRWLDRWGLTYYGCCEPLDVKMDILRRIPNLRKVSMSPWVDPARGAAALGGEYVYSCKPSPAILAEDRWRPDLARKQLREVLKATRGLPVEIIMKDISTVRYDPKRLWEWSRVAMELAEEFAP